MSQYIRMKTKFRVCAKNKCDTWRGIVLEFHLKYFGHVLLPIPGPINSTGVNGNVGIYYIMKTFILYHENLHFIS